MTLWAFEQVQEVDRLRRLEREVADLELAQKIARAYHRPQDLAEEAQRIRARARRGRPQERKEEDLGELLSFYQRVARRKNAAEAHEHPA